MMTEKFAEQQSRVSQQISQVEIARKSMFKKVGQLTAACREKLDEIESPEQRRLAEDFVEMNEKLARDLNTFANGLIDAIIALQAEYDRLYLTMENVITGAESPGVN